MGKISACALDVIENELGLYYNDYKYKTIKNHYLSILKEMPNVLLTPHMAFYTKQAVSDMVENSLLSIVTQRGKENKFRFVKKYLSYDNVFNTLKCVKINVLQLMIRIDLSQRAKIS
ncbi:MAG: hypothetical protein ACLTAI_14465 [Thomasclavelia sp.]